MSTIEEDWEIDTAQLINKAEQDHFKGPELLEQLQRASGCVIVELVGKALVCFGGDTAQRDRCQEYLQWTLEDMKVDSCPGDQLEHLRMHRTQLCLSVILLL